MSEKEFEDAIHFDTNIPGEDIKDEISAPHKNSSCNLVTSGSQNVDEIMDQFETSREEVSGRDKNVNPVSESGIFSGPSSDCTKQNLEKPNINLGQSTLTECTEDQHLNEIDLKILPANNKTLIKSDTTCENNLKEINCPNKSFSSSPDIYTNKDSSSNHILKNEMPDNLAHGIKNCLKSDSIVKLIEKDTVRKNVVLIQFKEGVEINNVLEMLKENKNFELLDSSSLMTYQQTEEHNSSKHSCDFAENELQSELKQTEEVNYSTTQTNSIHASLSDTKDIQTQTIENEMSMKNFPNKYPSTNTLHEMQHSITQNTLNVESEFSDELYIKDSTEPYFESTDVSLNEAPCKAPETPEGERDVNSYSDTEELKSAINGVFHLLSSNKEEQEKDSLTNNDTSGGFIAMESEIILTENETAFQLNLPYSDMPEEVERTNETHKILPFIYNTHEEFENKMRNRKSRENLFNSQYTMTKSIESYTTETQAKSAPRSSQCISSICYSTDFAGKESILAEKENSLEGVDVPEEGPHVTHSEVFQEKKATPIEQKDTDETSMLHESIFAVEQSICELERKKYEDPCAEQIIDMQKKYDETDTNANNEPNISIKHGPHSFNKKLLSNIKMLKPDQLDLPSSNEVVSEASSLSSLSATSADSISQDISFNENIPVAQQQSSCNNDNTAEKSKSLAGDSTYLSIREETNSIKKTSYLDKTNAHLTENDQTEEQYMSANDTNIQLPTRHVITTEHYISSFPQKVLETKCKNDQEFSNQELFSINEQENISSIEEGLSSNEEFSSNEHENQGSILIKKSIPSPDKDNVCDAAQSTSSDENNNYNEKTISSNGFNSNSADQKLSTVDENFHTFSLNATLINQDSNAVTQGSISSNQNDVSAIVENFPVKENILTLLLETSLKDHENHYDDRILSSCLQKENVIPATDQSLLPEHSLEEDNYILDKKQQTNSTKNSKEQEDVTHVQHNTSSEQVVFPVNHDIPSVEKSSNEMALSGEIITSHTSGKMTKVAMSLINENIPLRNGDSLPISTNESLAQVEASPTTKDISGTAEIIPLYKDDIVDRVMTPPFEKVVASEQVISSTDNAYPKVTRPISDLSISSTEVINLENVIPNEIYKLSEELLTAVSSVNPVTPLTEESKELTGNLIQSVKNIFSLADVPPANIEESTFSEHTKISEKNLLLSDQITSSVKEAKSHKIVSNVDQTTDENDNYSAKVVSNSEFFEQDKQVDLSNVSDDQVTPLSTKQVTVTSQEENSSVEHPKESIFTFEEDIFEPIVIFPSDNIHVIEAAISHYQGDFPDERIPVSDVKGSLSHDKKAKDPDESPSICKEKIVALEEKAIIPDINGVSDENVNSPDHKVLSQLDVASSIEQVVPTGDQDISSVTENTSGESILNCIRSCSDGNDCSIDQDIFIIKQAIASKIYSKKILSAYANVASREQTISSNNENIPFTGQDISHSKSDNFPTETGKDSADPSCSIVKNIIPSAVEQVPEPDQTKHSVNISLLEQANSLGNERLQEENHSLQSPSSTERNYSDKVPSPDHLNLSVKDSSKLHLSAELPLSEEKCPSEEKVKSSFQDFFSEKIQTVELPLQEEKTLSDNIPSPKHVNSSRSLLSPEHVNSSVNELSPKQDSVKVSNPSQSSPVIMPLQADMNPSVRPIIVSHRESSSARIKSPSLTIANSNESCITDTYCSSLFGQPSLRDENQKQDAKSNMRWTVNINVSDLEEEPLLTDILEDPFLTIRNYEDKESTEDSEQFDKPGFHKRAKGFLKKKDFTAVLEECYKAATICPNYPDAYAYMGLANALLNRLEYAVYCYRKARKLKPRDTSYGKSLRTVEKMISLRDLVKSVEDFSHDVCHYSKPTSDSLLQELTMQWSNLNKEE